MYTRDIKYILVWLNLNYINFYKYAKNSYEIVQNWKKTVTNWKLHLPNKDFEGLEVGIINRWNLNW